MMRFSRFTKRCALSIAAVCLGFVSSAQAQTKDIVDTAVEAGSFKTLTAAAKAAGLVDALKGDGPLTVFAPTDEAFAKLPEGTVESLLKPENKEKLAAILTYHVVSGKVLAEQVVGLSGAQTLNGQRLDVKVDGSKVKVDSANVVKTDIECSNGVIHVIDSVVLPADANIVETAVEAGTFKTLVAAAKAAGLAETLVGTGPLTVFAPTDEAFAKLPEGTVETLLKPENKGQLANILKHHVAAGRVYSEDVLESKSVKTLLGTTLKAEVKGGNVTIAGAGLVATDVDASNGVVHIIDTVLLPPQKSENSAANGREIIRKAIAKGAHMYNRGHHSACADVYMRTMTQLMDADLPVDDHAKRRMQMTVSTAKHTTCPTARSWALRHELDRIYASIQ